MTAAPSMMRAVGASNRPIEPKTRAVIPTDVATIAAPMNIASTNNPPHAIAIKYPATNGSKTPRTPTVKARFPTLKIACGLVSRPTLKSRKITPNSANTLIISVGATHISTLGPIITPARISPTTAGCFNRSKTSAISLAAASIINRSSRMAACSTLAARIIGIDLLSTF